MKKLIGIILSVALLVTMMPVCSIAAETVQPSKYVVFQMTPLNPLDSEPETARSFFMNKGVARIFLCSKVTLNLKTDQTDVKWLAPRASYFQFYKKTADKNNKVKWVKDNNPPFTLTCNAKTKVDLSAYPGISPISIKLTKYTGFNDTYRLKYLKGNCTEGLDYIELNTSNFENPISNYWIDGATKPNLSELTDADKGFVTGKNYYLYDLTEGNVVNWNAPDFEKNAKIYNEYGKNVTSKFTLGKDSNNGDATYIKTDKKIYGFYQLVYKNAGTYVTAFFTVNDDALTNALNSTVKVTAKAAKKKVTLSLKKTSKYVQDGYQIYRSTTNKSGSFKKIASTANASYVNKNLKSKKTYYYKVRTYKMINGTYYYSKWSKVTKVKAK